MPVLFVYTLCFSFICILIVAFYMRARLFLVVCFSFAGLLLWAQGGVRPLVVAHRGGAGEGLENVLSNIKKSVELGVYAVEVDVRLTADGCVVLCHDATVNSTTNGKGRVSRLSLKELQSFRIVDGKGCVTNETIPTLRQVLQFVDGRCKVLVEIKEGGRGIEEAVVEDVLACDAVDWVAVHSFSDEVLLRLRGMDAPFPLEKLIVFKVPLLPLIFDGTLRFFSFEKYSYISSFNFHKRCLPRSLAAKIRARGKAVKVWTVRSAADVPAAEVDAVITDYPSSWNIAY